ncbi:hypothetical protein BDN72DRAFT_895824 [Pluteus cervinus]|uniref:Uncharacterized protein n=1 Tax=Pluteus cervinus TaxID=181527 RepID=A0ACD3B0T8_9AGAR|nr:hypothetical protein BDN72DRAFT_895824 [Pluteus cervinus]
MTDLQLSLQAGPPPSTHSYAGINPKDIPLRPPPHLTIWIYCTDHEFELQENHHTPPGFAKKTPGKVTDDVIAQIKEAEAKAGKLFHINILGHDCCREVTGSDCVPGEADGKKLVRQNLRTQLEALIRVLSPMSKIHEVPEGTTPIHPEDYRGDFPGATEGDGDQEHLCEYQGTLPVDGGNPGFWAWVLEADGLFHWVYVADPRQPGRF